MSWLQKPTIAVSPNFKIFRCLANFAELFSQSSDSELSFFIDFYSFKSTVVDALFAHAKRRSMLKRFFSNNVRPFYSTALRYFTGFII